MQKLITSLVCCFCANAALSGIIISSPDAGWYNQGWLEGEEFRWGATARNMDFSNGDWVLGIGSNAEMNNGSQADFEWDGPGTSYPFALHYEPSAELALWTVGGQETVLQSSSALFTDMYIQLKGRPDTSQACISISSATLNVEGSLAGIDNFAAGYGETDNLRYIHINHSDGPLSDLDFVLAGTLHIDWTGAVPSRDDVAIHVKMSQIPEPASIIMVIVVSGLGLIIRRRFRP